ncbi:MAG: hypothetical protein IIU14_05090 [Ruminococcus sp.]|nr:hypothetical protein [Ruminococcus sp.]
MLTALTINEIKSDKWYINLLERLRGNSVKTEIKSARGVVLRHITVDKRCERLDWELLDSIIGAQRNHLICSDSIILPKELGFKRFDDSRFRSLLSLNLTLKVISKLKNKLDLSFALFDPEGDFPYFVPEASRYCSDIVAVTDNPEKYEQAVQTAADDNGASIQLTQSRDRLMDRTLITSPAQIREPLPLPGDSVTLTGKAPTVCLAGLVYFDYHFRMPNMFDRLKPSELSEVYFSAALFTKARQHELGSIVPTTCFNFSSSQTPRSLCEFIAGKGL